mmetsp:Transcript_46515/g.116976  ORF Transcript_46515/g.116976 Transcript_46515/m.116976 type:complete len:284 (-) Transcript_46515:578-1429(-)
MTGHLPPKQTRPGASGELWHANRGPALRSLLIAKEGAEAVFQTFACPSRPAVMSKFFVGASCTTVQATSCAASVQSRWPSALLTIFLTSKQATPPLSTLARHSKGLCLLQMADSASAGNSVVAAAPGWRTSSKARRRSNAADKRTACSVGCHLTHCTLLSWCEYEWTHLFSLTSQTFKISSADPEARTFRLKALPWRQRTGPSCAFAPEPPRPDAPPRFFLALPFCFLADPKTLAGSIGSISSRSQIWMLWSMSPTAPKLPSLAPPALLSHSTQSGYAFSMTS